MSSNKLEAINLTRRLFEQAETPDSQFSLTLLVADAIEHLYAAKDAAERRAEEARDKALEEASQAVVDLIELRANPGVQISNALFVRAASVIDALRAHLKQPEAVGLCGGVATGCFTRTPTAYTSHGHTCPLSKIYAQSIGADGATG